MSYSVVMPVYNGRDFFKFALESAVVATDKCDEIIVVEDGSSDGGVRDIVDMFQHDREIRYLSKSNGGVATALNLGLENCRNPNFSWLSHDDLYLKNRFKSDRGLREYSPDTVTVSDFYLLESGSNQLTYINSTPNLGNKQRFRLLSRRFLNGNCLTAPVETLLSCGGFESKRKHTQDYALWLKIMDRTSFVAVPEPTVLSRQHPNQDSKTQPVAARQEYYTLLKENISWKDLIDPRNSLDLLRILNSLFGR